MKKSIICTIILTVLICFFCSWVNSKNTENKNLQIHNLIEKIWKINQDAKGAPSPLINELFSYTLSHPDPEIKKLYLEEEGNPCIATMTINRVDSPWREISGDVVKAEEMDARRFVPPNSLAKYSVGGSPLFGIDKEQKLAVVNNKYFTDLNPVDATLIGKGESKTIGRILNFSGLSMRKAVEFLLDSQIIRTYWHLEARLCLTKEERSEREYIFYYNGVHSYCTNECIDEKFKFAVKIDKATGEISLLGI